MARVQLGDISPTAPRSSLEALDAGPCAYGPETPVVWQLAVASVAKRPAASASRAVLVTPCVMPTQATPALAARSVHATDAQHRAKHDAAICLFMDAWPASWVARMLGSEAQAARTSRRAAAVALEEHLRLKGGSDGASLRGAVSVIFGELGYVRYRRAYGEPECWDFPITGAELVAFCAHRHATSTATARGGGHAVRQGVLAIITAAARHYCLPVDLDCILIQFAAPRVAREQTPAVACRCR